MTTLLVGATGLLGPDICEHLTTAGHRVRALVRPTSDPEKRAALLRFGAELVEGDLKEPASIARACAGIDAVISTASATLSRQSGDSIETVDRDGQLTLVDAARAAGVKRFVFVSFRENPSVQFPLTIAKRAVERAITASGMSYTILQASYFMEVWLTPALGFDVANRQARIYGDGHQPVSWISYRDVAHAAAAAVINSAGQNMVVELGGPQALSPRDVVTMFEAAGSGSIAIETVPVGVLEGQLRQASDSLQQTFAGLMLQYAGGDAIDTAVGRRLFPFPMTSVGDFVAVQVARSA